MFHVPERHRVTTGVLRSTPDYGNNGCFRLTLRVGGKPKLVQVIASDDDGWEHVSVVWSGGMPSWEMMCAVKELFWDPEDCVVQFHPPRSEHVNVHPTCLHLWRPTTAPIECPPKWMIG